MTVTMAQVRAVLDPEEPDYGQASKLGPGTIPHLEKLVKEADALLASKAAYLAALMQDERSVRVVKEAAQREDPVVRVAAAAAARYLPCSPVSEILISLVNDKDAGVRKVALESTQADATAELRACIERLTTDDPDPGIQRLARQVLRRIAFGYHPEHGGTGEGGSGMGGSKGSQGVDSGMGRPIGVEGMGSPTNPGGMGQYRMGSDPEAMGRASGAGRGPSGEGATDERAVAWERAAVAWEKKRECGCGSRSYGT